MPEEAKAPQQTFAAVPDLLTWLEATPSEPYALHFAPETPRVPVTGASLHFTTDGGLIVALACHGSQQDAESLLSQVRAAAGAAHGYLTLESPPPETTATFIATSTAFLTSHSSLD